MRQYTPNNRAVPQVVAADALTGIPGTVEVDADRIEAMPSVASSASTHVYSEQYRYVPYVNPDGSPGVRYYIAQNNETGRHEYVIPPSALDSFIKKEGDYEFAWDIGHVGGEAPAQSVYAMRVVRDMLDGDVEGALGQVGAAWKDAATDPYYYMQVGSLSATVFMNGAGPRRPTAGDQVDAPISPNVAPQSLPDAGVAVEGTASVTPKLAGEHTVLAGHGELRYPYKQRMLGEGQSLLIPKPNHLLSEPAGQALERGGLDGLKDAASKDPSLRADLDAMLELKPGEKYWDYTLLPPDHPGMPPFLPQPSSVTVPGPTKLSELIGDAPGCYVWAACTKLTD